MHSAHKECPWSINIVLDMELFICGECELVGNCLFSHVGILAHHGNNCDQAEENVFAGVAISEISESDIRCSIL